MAELELSDSQFVFSVFDDKVSVSQRQFQQWKKAPFQSQAVVGCPAWLAALSLFSQRSCDWLFSFLWVLEQY